MKHRSPWDSDAYYRALKKSIEIENTQTHQTPMTYYNKPKVENAANEQMWTVADASKWLPGPAVQLDVLRTLGSDASRCARIWKRPTGTKPTPHQPWPSEKTYTLDVLREVFRLNPATREAYAQLVAKQGV